MARTIIAAIILMTATAFSQLENARTIRVHGVGKVQAVPDQVLLSINANVPLAETVNEAFAKSNEIINKVLKLLKDQGISEQDIQTNQINVSPVYDQEKRQSQPPVIGYSANNVIRVRVRKIRDAGTILDKAVEMGATGFGPLSYDISTRKEIEREALTRAGDDAKDKAELLARHMGVSLGQIITISESGITSPYLQRAFGMDAARISAQTVVMPGEMEISANVEVVFELK